MTLSPVFKKLPGVLKVTFKIFSSSRECFKLRYFHAGLEYPFLSQKIFPGSFLVSAALPLPNSFRAVLCFFHFQALQAELCWDNSLFLDWDFQITGGDLYFILQVFKWFNFFVFPLVAYITSRKTSLCL